MRSAVLFRFEANEVVVIHIDSGARQAYMPGIAGLKIARRDLSMRGFVHEHSTEDFDSLVELWVKPAKQDGEA